MPSVRQWWYWAATVPHGVDPGHDVTPVYPWDPKRGWGSWPANEEAVDRVSLPPNSGTRYTVPDAKAGVATMVLFARNRTLVTGLRKSPRG